MEENGKLVSRHSGGAWSPTAQSHPLTGPEKRTERADLSRTREKNRPISAAGRRQAHDLRL